ncbi:MAG: MFS transporter [Candidatus Ranarchaeia archaeon]
MLLFLNVMTSISMRFFGLFLPLVGQSLGANEIVTGISLSLGGLIRTLVLIPAGLIADRTRYDRLFLLFGILGQTSALFFLSLATQPWHLFLISPLQGATQAIILGFLLSRIAVYAEKTKIGRSISYYTATFSLGLTIGSSVGGPIIEFFGLNVAYNGLAMLIAVAAVSLLAYGPQSNIVGEQTGTPVAPAGSKLKGKKVVYPRPFLHLLGSYLVHNLGFGGFYVFFVLYVIYIGGTPMITGLADGISQLVGLILIPIMGELADRKSPKLLIMIAFWGDFLLFVLLRFVYDPLLILPLMVLNGVNGSASMTGLLAMAASYVKDNKGTALATANTFVNMGFTISPLIGGFLLSMGGFPLLMLYSIAMLFVAAGWAFVKVNVPQSEHINNTNDNSILESSSETQNF